MAFRYIVVQIMIYYLIIRSTFSVVLLAVRHINNWIIQEGLNVMHSYITALHKSWVVRNRV